MAVNMIFVLFVEKLHLCVKLLFGELPHLVVKLDDDFDLIINRQYTANMADLRDAVFFAGGAAHPF